MTTSKRSTAKYGEEEPTLFAVGSRAKKSADSETKQGLTDSGADYGSTCSESFAEYDRDTSSWRTSQRCLTGKWAEFSEAWPKAGTMRSGHVFRRVPLVDINGAIVCGLSPIPHEMVARRYFIKTPSMLSAIVRGWMLPVEDGPTLTTKIVERAPCPYWPTPLGPRYLTESEAERMAGFPPGWTDTVSSETPSSRKS